MDAIAKNLATKYLTIIANLTPAEILTEIENPRDLLIDTCVHYSKRLDIAYAPFDHVNDVADIVIIGVTPGKQQMQADIKEARKAMALGLSEKDVLARAKVHAGFAGSMRKNLIKMMDALGVNELLNMPSTSTLWGSDNHRVHFTSTLRYPTFVNGKNYSRSPHLNKVPFLFNLSKKWLEEELSLLPNALIVPMGDGVSQVLEHLFKNMPLIKDRILFGMPHASSAANGWIARFLSGNADDAWHKRFIHLKNKIDVLIRETKT